MESYYQLIFLQDKLFLVLLIRIHFHSPFSWFLVLSISCSLCFTEPHKRGGWRTPVEKRPPQTVPRDYSSPCTPQVTHQSLEPPSVPNIVRVSNSSLKFSLLRCDLEVLTCV